jgi:hypothetical protein
MGCWDVFCFICGNPCHSFLNGYIDSIEETINEEIKSSYPKFVKDELKKLKEYKNLITDLKKLEKKIKWMNKCSMLLINDKIVHGLEESACNVFFENKKFGAEHIQMQNSCDASFVEKGNCGIFIHTDCWKFIKKEYNVELKFSNLPKLQKINWNKNFDINYGTIEKYWIQDFNFTNLVCDKNQYLCSSPLVEDKNMKQIKKNINSLKIKNDPNRIGPSVSATFYNNGDIKIGKNKYFWIKKNDKWLQINEKPIKINIEINYKKISKKIENYLIKIPFIGQYNIEPIFIISSQEEKSIYNIQLILIESYKETLMKKIN